MIENAVLLLRATHDREIAAMLDAHEAAVAGHDRLAYDDAAGSATLSYRRGEHLVARYAYEPIATYDERTRVFRWGWDDGARGQALRVDAIRRAGVDGRLTALASSPLHDVHPADAERLVGLGAHLAGARGVVRCGEEAVVTWLALFEPAPRASLRERAPIQTMPPSGLGDATPALAVQTPAMRRVLPLVDAARDDLRASAMGFKEAALVVRVDLRQEKARFVVQLSAVDADGALQVPEPSAALMDACARFLRADAAAGNGRWQRLLVRLSSDLHGANVAELQVA